MKMSLFKHGAFALAVAFAAGLMTPAFAADGDDVAERTERELFRMSQVDTGKKKVRVISPERPAAAQAPMAAEMPAEMAPDQATPMPATEHNPTLLTEGCGVGCDSCGGSGCDECNACGCDDLCCDCLCGPPGRTWVRADVLGWWTKGMSVPALVTQGTSQAQPGVLGQPGTQVLVGGGKFNDTGIIGGRLSAGMWLDACHKWGIEGDYFALGDQHESYFINGSTHPYLSRPLIDVTNGLPGSAGVELVNGDTLCGDVSVASTTSFQGAGALLRKNLCCTTSCCDKGGNNPCDPNNWSANCCRVDFITGYRYYRLADDVNINEYLKVVAAGGQVAQGTTYTIRDQFMTKNEFHGGVLGLSATKYRGRWSLQSTATVALGNNHSTVRIAGQTIVRVPNQAAVVANQGVYAQGSNSGIFTRDDFVAIPQVGFDLGYQWSCHFRTFVGYNFLYWTNAVRAGNQITTQVDRNQLPPTNTTGTNPAFAFHDTSFWAQGINLGAEFRW